MIKLRPRIPFFYYSWDVLMFMITLLVSFYFYEDDNYQGIGWSVFTALFLLWFLTGYRQNLQQLKKASTLPYVNYIRYCVILVGLILIIFTIVPLQSANIHVVLGFVIGFPVVAIPVNLLMSNVESKLKKKTGQIKYSDNTKYTLVAGVGSLAGSYEKQMSTHYNSSYKIKGFINCKKEECVVGQEKVVGDLEHINDYLRDNPVDEIVIALPVKISKKIKSILRVADYHGVRVKYIPDYQGLFGSQYKTVRYGQIDAVNVRQLPLDETSAFLAKVAFDKVFSIIALLLLLPFLLILGIMVKLDSPGAVFYCPIRIGKGGRPFRVFKFRSMREGDAVVGERLSTQKNDARITRLGRIMRKYSLDELPQFLNVLLGDMSVVGPRPHRSYLNQQLQESVDKYMIRHYFKPGITGWAQVNGWRGPTETSEQRTQRTLHDIWYMENWSLWLDIKIICLTLFSRKAHKSAF